MTEARVYDLHTHTFYSDGALSPAELVARAAAHGVQVLALTDHDVTDGLPEARAAAEAAGITLVPGVEISVTWSGLTVHVVGLNIDIANATLQAGLARMREFREWRADEIGRLGVDRVVAGTTLPVRRQAEGRA